jgi:hypothetical protein
MEPSVIIHGNPEAGVPRGTNSANQKAINITYERVIKPPFMNNGWKT